MSQPYEEARDKAMALNPEERSALAEDLWDSNRTAEELEIDRAWTIEVERRVAEIDAGIGTLIPGDDVIRELRAKYGKRSRRT
jgi:putative addiction module component (TIGR02574 family)